MKFYLLEELNVSTKLLIQKMRITCFMLFVFATGVFATTATSQVAKVSINLKNATVEKVIDSIEKQTDYLFVYNKNDIDITREVTVDIENLSVAEVLSEIFDKTNIIYGREQHYAYDALLRSTTGEDDFRKNYRSSWQSGC